MENKEILLAIGEDGIAREYDDTYDVTIHCESKEDQEKLMSSLVIPIVGKTNGDMIQKLIPIEDMWRGYSTERGKQVCVRFAHAEYVTCFDADYWDAPYKAEVEPQESEG